MNLQLLNSRIQERKKNTVGIAWGRWLVSSLWDVMVETKLKSWLLALQVEFATK